MAADKNRFQYRQFVEQRRVLEGTDKSSSDGLCHRSVRQRLASKKNTSRAGFVESAHRVEQRGLARAVRSYQSVDRLGLDRHGKAVDGARQVALSLDGVKIESERRAFDASHHEQRKSNDSKGKIVQNKG